jgi:hypothetical protein
LINQNSVTNYLAPSDAPRIANSLSGNDYTGSTVEVYSQSKQITAIYGSMAGSTVAVPGSTVCQTMCGSPLNQHSPQVFLDGVAKQYSLTPMTVTATD